MVSSCFELDEDEIIQTFKEKTVSLKYTLEVLEM